MAFETQTKKLASGGLLKTVETKVSGNFTVESDVQIDKVLDGFAYCQIEQCERTSDDSLAVTGQVNFSSVYVDTEKRLHGTSFQVELNERVQLAEADGVVVVPRLVALKQKKETSNYVEVVATFVMEVYGVVQETICYIDANPQEFVEKKCVEKEVSVLACNNIAHFSVNGEHEVFEDNVNVICAPAKLKLEKVQPNGNYVTLDGEVVVDVVYTSGDGEQLKKLEKRLDFSQEVSLQNCTPESIVNATLNVCDCRVMTDIPDEESKPKLTFDIAIACGLWGYQKERLSLVEDVFSTKNKLSMTTNFCEVKDYLPMLVLEDRVNLIFDCQGQKRIDEILYAGRTQIDNARHIYENERLQLDCDISQMVIAKNYDSDEIFCCLIKSPATFQFVVEAEAGSQFYTSLSLNCSSFKNKVGKEVQFTYDVNVVARVDRSEHLQFVSECCEQEAIEPFKHSIVVYMPEANERVFDIAKRLCVSPDCILSQNPAIEDGKPIEKVVVYR